MSGRALATVLGLGAFLSIASPTRASGADRAAYAERLFQQGFELMQRDRCHEAIPEFLSSQRLDPSAATLMNLATCYARVGKKATAWKTYHQAAIAAAGESDPNLRALAFQGMSTLSPVLTKIRIVRPKSMPAVSLKLNGEPLDEFDTLPVPLEPGENILEAVAPGREPWRRRVTADELGATLVIEVPELPAAPPEAEHRASWRTPAILVGGAGVAAVVAGSVLALSASQTYDESEGQCRLDRCNARGVELRDSALHKAAVSSYLVGLGSVAAVSGLVLWFVAPTTNAERVAVPVVAPLPSGVALTLEGPL